MNDSPYLPTPQRTIKAHWTSVAMPCKVCFMDLVQLDKFVKQIIRFVAATLLAVGARWCQHQ